MKLKGTAAMTVEKRKQVCRQGGLAVSKDKAHMAKIGRMGGLKASQDRERMAKIGQKGGLSSSRNKGNQDPQVVRKSHPLANSEE